MPELLLDAAVVAAHPPRCRASTPAARHRTRECATPRGPPSVEEIVAVLRAAGDSQHGRRLRRLIVVRGAPNRGSVRRSRSPRPTSTSVGARYWSGAARVAAGAKSAWTTGLGAASALADRSARAPSRPAPAVLHHHRPHARSALVARGRPGPIARHRSHRRRPAPLRPAPTASRPRRRTRARRRPAGSHPAPAPPQQPRHHVRLPTRH
jgi:hypothetical protein